MTKLTKKITRTKLMYRLMLSFFAIMVLLMIILSISFIDVTNRSMYRDTWRQLRQDSDSLIQDSIRYDPVEHDFKGFATPELETNARLLAHQDVHFAIYDTSQQQVFTSNGFTPTITAANWAKLKKGQTVYIKLTTPRVSKKVSRTSLPRMTVILRPYRVKKKLVAVVAIATFVSSLEENMHEIKLNLLVALFFAGVLTIIASYIFSRSVTIRINRLRNLTYQVTKGNYNVRLRIMGNDEIGDLARSFNQMTASLQNSQAEIHRQEERRRQFMANAAHEMRTPLTTINGILEGLQYDVIPEEDKKHSIELMQNETKRLIRLVNDNLNYEKIRTNQISMDRKLFDAAAVLHNLKEQLTKKASAQGDQIDLAVADGLLVYADYDHFVQIMFNIIQNAIQFTKNGHIHVRGKQVARGTEFVIQDDGIGMAPDQLDNIWERYYKADKSRMNTKYGESGLGLAIVHQLVNLHNGKITVKSKIGVGSTFTVFFPNSDEVLPKDHDGDEN